MRAVDRRTFETTDGEAVRAEFFPDGTPTGEAGDLVEDAIANVLVDEWDAAATSLLDAFAEQSICAKEKPDYEVTPEHGSNQHYAACHLHHAGVASEAPGSVPSLGDDEGDASVAADD